MRKPIVVALSVALLATLAMAATAADVRAQATSYSGRATALRASVFGVNAVFADTGPLPAAGGTREASFVGLNLLGLLRADTLTASAQGQGDQSLSRSSLSGVAVRLPGLTLRATAVGSQAEARCEDGQPQVSGTSEVAGLRLNGRQIVSTDLPQLRIPVGPYTVAVNEQTTSTSGNRGEVTVNAVHVYGPGVDVWWPPRTPTSSARAIPSPRRRGPEGRCA